MVSNSPDDLENLIVSLLSITLEPSAFQYLLACWKRVFSIQRTIRAHSDAEQKISFLGKAEELLVSYAGLSISMPEMFSIQNPLTNLENLLLQSANSDLSIPPKFISDLAKRFHGDGLEMILGPAMSNICGQILQTDFTQPFNEKINVLVQLTSNKEVAEMFTQLPHFLPADITPSGIEMGTLLGACLHISPLKQETASHLFPDTQNTRSHNVQGIFNSIRLSLSSLQDSLFLLCNNIVRASPIARQRLLDFFAKTVNLNKKRRALQVDSATVASDGFMFNLSFVLTKFCQPFLDFQFSKIDKADVMYFRRDHRVDISEDTKLHADNELSEKYFGSHLEGENNFISEIFFLAVATYYFGLSATQSTLENTHKEVQEVKRFLARLQNNQESWANGPRAALMRNAITRAQTQLEQVTAKYLAYESVVRQPSVLSDSITFAAFVANWIIRLAEPNHSYPQKSIDLPLPSTIIPEFATLPEYFVEVCAEIISNAFKFSNGQSLGIPAREACNFCIVFLFSTQYINNPHLKAKLAEVLYFGIITGQTGEPGLLSDYLNSSPFSQKYLFPAVMAFYSEVEHTGLHSQFYDKFNIRYHLSQVMKNVWQNQQHRQMLAYESKNDVDRFVQFIALMLNDATYLLDEGLSKLQEIHNLQKSVDASGAAVIQESQEREQNLQSAERQASIYMSLGTDTIELLINFTELVPDAFVYPEIVDRLAAMLNFNIQALVGPKCTGLRVQNPEKYRFDAKMLLSKLLTIYMNLRQKDPFVLAVARDARSFRKEYFVRAGSILTRYAVSKPDVHDLMTFVDSVEKAKALDEAGEEEMGEIPDEFLGKAWFIR